MNPIDCLGVPELEVLPECFPSCPEGQEFSIKSRKCEDKCPQGQMFDSETQVCYCTIEGSTPIDNKCVCENNFKPIQDEFGNLIKCQERHPIDCIGVPELEVLPECMPSCLKGQYFNTKTRKCEEVCPPGQIFNEEKQECVESGCHKSCYCEYNKEKCASCHICLRCRQPSMTILIGQDFCQCNTPDFRLKKDSDYECEPVDTPQDVPKCEWQLFNQINKMVVHSNCSFKVDDSNNKTYIVDELSYDWRQITNVNLDKDCINQLNTKMLISRNCNGDYEDLSNYGQYATVLSNQTNITIPLIELYSLSSIIDVQDRHIYQKLCLAIELSHARKTLRRHQFELRVYTNRDQYEVFHLNVSQQYTEGCDRGQECIIVADLDTKGDICKDSTCSQFYASNVVPVYTIGDNMYVRIQFVDNTYTKFLHVVSVKFIDDQGIYSYERNVQFFTQKQDLGLVDVRIYLFQPHQNAQIEISLKISLEKDSLLRSLQQKNQEEKVVEIFKANVQQKSLESKSSLSQQILFGFISMILLIIIA